MFCTIFNFQTRSRACLKNHFRNLHAPLCGIFHPNSVAVARYGALIRAKYPTNCDAHLAESLFQTRSRENELARGNLMKLTAENSKGEKTKYRLARSMKEWLLDSISLVWDSLT